MSDKQVRAILGARYKFRRERKEGDAGAVDSIFGGGLFADLTVDSVTTINCKGTGFSYMMVVLRGPSSRPLYRRWSDLVRMVTRKYGPPPEVEEPPSAAAVKDLEPADGEDSMLLASMKRQSEQAAYDRVTEDLKAGGYQLAARWRFAQGRLIAVSVDPGDLTVVWSFADMSRLQPCLAAAQKPSDF